MPPGTGLQPPPSHAEVLARHEALSKNGVPRYLWRAYANDSNGLNTTRTFASAAAKNGKGHLLMPDEDLRTMLTKHFQWLDVQNDEFISWTSSLLYALQYAVRKTRNPKNPRTVSQECDIKICLWERDAAGNPIYPASNLIEFYRLPSEGVLRPEYHITEYLSHGKIDVKGCSSTVSLEELRRAGLFDLMPELDDENTKHDLFTRVLTLRSTILTTPIAISDFESKTARGIASLFARQYTMQAMLALLSLRLRDCEDAEFINMIQHDAIPLRNFLVPCPKHIATSPDAPEVSNFANMMNATFVHVEKIIKSRARDAISRLGNALTDVTLGFEKVADSLGDTEGKDRVLSQLSATSAALRGFAAPVADGDVDALATALEQSKISTPGPIMIGREGPMPGEQSTSADSGRAGSQELGVADDDG